MLIVTIFVGNHTTGEGIDYYTSSAFPYFAIIPAYSTGYTLKINIVADRILEDNELFYVIANPEHFPYGQPDCRVTAIIRDDDGNF